MPSTISGHTFSLTGTSAQRETLQAAILGSDLVLGSLPAEPVQVINACFALGYDIVVPASWGDEIIASSVLDELSDRPPGTAILCACPNARERLLSTGNELLPFMLHTVSPPVAAARYLRAVHGASSLHITFVGACCGADDESISERLTPSQFLEMCTKRGVSLTDQPRVFESCIPTDRRRHFSLPGGLPTPEAVRAVHAGTDVLSMDSNSLAFDLTQCIISGRNALLDLAPAVGCPCSGFVGVSAWNDGRETLAALEPPRSPTPVVDGRIIVDLELPGHTPAIPSYEESVPLNVVVGADLSEFGREFHEAVEARGDGGASHADETPASRDAELPGGQTLLAQAASAIEMSWNETALDFDVAMLNSPRQDRQTPVSSFTQRDAEAEHPRRETPETEPARTATPAAPIPIRRSSGTPTGTPAMRTPAGPLPRAYLMQRRLVTGEDPTLPVPEVAPANPVIDNNQLDTAQSVESNAASTLPPAPSRSPRGTVDSVLDILSKAIRDVVEP